MQVNFPGPQLRTDIPLSSKLHADPARRLVFLASHRGHRKIIDRLQGALAAGLRVEMFAYDRGEIEHEVFADPRIRYVSLGAIRNGVGMSRLRGLWGAVRVLVKNRRQIIESNAVVLVNTLELLLLARLLGLTRRTTVYDVLDIHTLLLSGGLAGRVARVLERVALRSVALLVVSSPWFYWDYFLRWQRTKVPALLVENKVITACTEPPPRSPGRTIAWNGLLRCRVSAETLLKCLRQDPTIQLMLHGTLTRLREAGERLTQSPQCRCTGPYQPRELSARLDGANFLWAVDFEDGDNSRWLLPNRLYEGIANGLPLMAVAGTATGEVVRHLDIGPVLGECSAEAISDALNRCTEADYARWLTHLRALRPRASVGREWQAIFENSDGWRSSRTLPENVDVTLVLA